MWHLSLIRLARGTKVRLVTNSLVEAITRCVETLYVTDRGDGNPLCSLYHRVPHLPADGYAAVILNGRVVERETEFDQIANVEIKDGIITAITTSEVEGTQTADATGQVRRAGARP